MMANGVNGKLVDWVRPDLPSRCTFSIDKSKEESPHHHCQNKKRPDICATSLNLIGNTPLIKLNKIPKEENIDCEILVKCEYMNTCGSIKDRIALRMIEEAERSGQLKPGDTIIEPTSGNTGLGLAIVSAVKGYRCIIVLPEKMSAEKVNLLKALGAETVRTRTSANFDDDDSHLLTAERIKRDIGSSAHILNQYIHPGNPLAHYDGTAEEIIDACAATGGVDMIVAGAGTGGTISGLARKIKQKLPNCKLIGVDPFGSILAQPDSLNKSDTNYYDVEGLGYDFIPTVLDRSLVDCWYKSDDKSSFLMSRRLIKEEGLLCGGSSGSNVTAAIRAIRDFGLDASKRVVVILPDTVRNYMSKFLTDDWLFQRNIIDYPSMATIEKTHLIGRQLADLLAPLVTGVPILSPDDTVGNGIAVLAKVPGGRQPLALVCSTPPSGDNACEPVGVFDSAHTMKALINGVVSANDPLIKATNKEVKRFPMSVSLEKLGRWLVADPYVLVGDLSSANFCVVSQMDYLNFMMKK